MIAIAAGSRNEIVKLFKRRKYQVFLLLMGLLSIATSQLGGVIKDRIGLSVLNTPFLVLSLATGFILPLIIAMAAADLFTAEQENGSIRAAITRPVSRLSTFISKVLAIVLYTLLVLLVCLVTSLVCGLISNGFGVLNIGEVILAYIVSVIPMLPMTLFAVSVSQLSRNSTSAVMLSVLGYTVIIATSIVMPSINPMLFSSYTGWYKLFIGEAIPGSYIFCVSILLAAYTLIFFAVSMWAFEKKEY